MANPVEKFTADQEATVRRTRAARRGEGVAIFYKTSHDAAKKVSHDASRRTTMKKEAITNQSHLKEKDDQKARIPLPAGNNKSGRSSITDHLHINQGPRVQI